MAASLKQRFGIDAELVRGGSGVFDVRVDGTLVFSKHQEHRFPDPGEVEASIERLRSAAG